MGSSGSSSSKDSSSIPSLPKYITWRAASIGLSGPQRTQSISLVLCKHQRTFSNFACPLPSRLRKLVPLRYRGIAGVTTPTSKGSTTTTMASPADSPPHNSAKIKTVLINSWDNTIDTRNTEALSLSCSCPLTCFFPKLFQLSLFMGCPGLQYPRWSIRLQLAHGGSSDHAVEHAGSSVNRPSVMYME